MKIGELAKRSGIKAETIRYYESVRMLAIPPRTVGNYREYDEADVARLVFIREARALGFELDEVRALVELDSVSLKNEDIAREVKRQLKLVDLKHKKLRALRAALKAIAKQPDVRTSHHLLVSAFSSGALSGRSTTT